MRGVFIGWWSVLVAFLCTWGIPSFPALSSRFTFDESNAVSLYFSKESTRKNVWNDTPVYGDTFLSWVKDGLAYYEHVVSVDGVFSRFIESLYSSIILLE